MRTYKLYAAASSGSNIANLSILKSGRIRCIRWAVTGDFDADGEYLNAEVSTFPSSQFAQNDSIGDIDMVRQLNASAAAGQILSAQNVTRNGLDYPIAQGERLYLHCETNCASGFISCFVDVQD